MKCDKGTGMWAQHPVEEESFAGCTRKITQRHGVEAGEAEPPQKQDR